MAEEERFLEASVTTRVEAVRVARLKLPCGVTDKMVEPLEEATIRMVLAVLVGAATTKEAVGVLVLIPTFELALTVKMV